MSSIAFPSYLIAPRDNRLDQQDDPRHVRVLHRVHRCQVELASVLFQGWEGLVDAQGMSLVRMSVDDYVVSLVVCPGSM